MIFSIAAAADCTWPYSSESSCSGWKSRLSRPMNAISVPSVSVPSSYSRDPSASTATVATTPNSSIAGKNSDERFWACWFERWLARLSSENCSRNASSRL